MDWIYFHFSVPVLSQGRAAELLWVWSFPLSNQLNQVLGEMEIYFSCFVSAIPKLSPYLHKAWAQPPALSASLFQLHSHIQQQSEHNSQSEAVGGRTAEKLWMAPLQSWVYDLRRQWISSIFIGQNTSNISLPANFEPLGKIKKICFFWEIQILICCYSCHYGLILLS